MRFVVYTLAFALFAFTAWLTPQYLRGARLSNGARLIETSRPPFPRLTNGMTVWLPLYGYVIFLRAGLNEFLRERVLLHEGEHVTQMRAEGPWSFYRNYFFNKQARLRYEVAGNARAVLWFWHRDIIYIDPGLGITPAMWLASNLVSNERWIRERVSAHQLATMIQKEAGRMLQAELDALPPTE